MTQLELQELGPGSRSTDGNPPAAVGHSPMHAKGGPEARGRAATSSTTSLPRQTAGEAPPFAEPATGVRPGEVGSDLGAGVSAAPRDLHRGPRVVLDHLNGQPHSARELAAETGLIQVATERHLQELEAAGLVVKGSEGWVRR